MQKEETQSTTSAKYRARHRAAISDRQGYRERPSTTTAESTALANINSLNSESGQQCTHRSRAGLIHTTLSRIDTCSRSPKQTRSNSAIPDDAFTMFIVLPFILCCIVRPLCLYHIASPVPIVVSCSRILYVVSCQSLDHNI